MPRVLVVEDEPIIALMLQDWLAEFGCETIGPAKTVSDALSLIHSTTFDCAILDFSLGREDCSQVADALRVRSIPFALASGHSVNSLSKSYTDALVLGKPYDNAAMRAVVGKMIAVSPS